MTDMVRWLWAWSLVHWWTYCLIAGVGLLIDAGFAGHRRANAEELLRD